MAAQSANQYCHYFEMTILSLKLVDTEKNVANVRKTQQISYAKKRPKISGTKKCGGPQNFLDVLPVMQ